MKLTNDDLLAIIKAHRADSLGADGSELSVERATAMDRYNGRPYGNEVDGRSQVVDRSTMEAVDWAMPSLMKIFTASGEIAEFAPIGQEDEQGAQQESDYVNHVMMQENNGFMVLHDAVMDTLLLKNGYTKEFWEEETKVSEEEYTGLTVEQATLTVRRLEQSGAKVEVIGAEERTIFLPSVIPQAQGDIPLQVWDAKLRITQKTGGAVWVAAPTEEIRVSKRCRGSLEESPFTEHVTKKTRSDLIEMGMPRDFVDGLAAYAESTASVQTLSRDTSRDESGALEQSGADRSMDEIEYCEAYIFVDWDDDGVAELRKVVTVSDQIPPGEEWNERLNENPLTGWQAKRVPHRHVGRSVYDELSDIEEILTVLKRQLLDNIYLNNNSETVINENANVKDFLTRQPGGIKRTKGTDPVQNAVMPLVTKPIVADILPVLDHFAANRQKRSGIEANTGVDADVLQQTTKAAFMENMNRLGAKLEMMARLLAETGVKQAVLKMHAILRRHQDIAKQVQLRGHWVTVNPRDWKERTDVRVKVGLGTGNEEEKRTKLGMLQQIQAQLLQMIGAAPPAVYAKAYALFEDLAKTMGAEMPEKYAIAPHSPEHQQILQQAQQAAQQAAQGQGGTDLAKAAQIQAEANMRVQSERNQANMQVKAAEDAFKREKAMLEARMDAQDAEAQRRHEIMLQQMKLASDEAREAMKQEVALLIKGMTLDLGRPGISAGVQGAMGVDPAMVQGVEQPAEQQMDGMQGMPMGGIMEHGPEEGQGPMA